MEKAFIISLSVLSIIDTIYHFYKSSKKSTYHIFMSVFYLCLATWGITILSVPFEHMEKTFIICLSILSGIDTLYHLFKSSRKQPYHIFMACLYLGLAIWGVTLLGINMFNV